MNRAKGFCLVWGILLLVGQVKTTRTCSHSISGNSGSISSPGYPGKYPNDQDCVWLITVDEGRYVMLNFTFFDVEFYPTGQSCIDVVEVKDGNSPESELMGTYCSGISAPRFPLYSSGNNIRVWFYSDAADQRKGFHAEYTSFPETGCGGSLTSDKGVITSPRYGSASPYPSSIDCEWTVTLDEGKFIKLWFEDISVELNAVKCFDRIDIWDGPSNNETFLGSVCQGVNPIFSKSNRLRLKFTTNKEGRGRGFQARYTSSLTTGCGGDYEGLSGNILSPNYPYSYLSMKDCIWRIEAPKNKYISIRFNEFIGMNGTVKSCAHDHVEIRDGYTKEAKSLGRFCNYNPPEVIVSSGNQMWVRFQSSISMTPGKFSAVFLVHSRDCNASIGMEDGRIADTQLTASSFSNYFPKAYSQAQQWSLLPKYGRLNGAYAWCSQAQGRQMIVGEYFQIDFRNLTKLTALATQGFVHQIGTANAGHVHIDSITSYKIEFSFDANYWMAYSDGSENSTAKGFTEFLGNYYVVSAVLNKLHPPIIADMIRVIPTNYASFLGHMCLRMEVFGCPYDLGCGKTLSIDVPGTINIRGHPTKETNCNYLTKPTPPSFKDLVLIWRFILFNIPCSSGHIIMQHKSGEAEKICDNNAPSTYIMKASQQLQLKVHLKKGTESQGLDISYKTESLGCGEILYVQRNASIASPRFPKHYGTEQRCVWILIGVGNTAKISVKFKEFELQPTNGSSQCADYVEIKNGQLADSPLVDRYCGKTLPMELTSTGNSLRIEFNSDKEITAKGFFMEYGYLPSKQQSQLKDLSQQSDSPHAVPPSSTSVLTTPISSWTLAILIMILPIMNIN